MTQATVTEKPGSKASQLVATCNALVQRYHEHEARVQVAIQDYGPEEFLRLFLIAHGMPPAGEWRSHTYAKFRNSHTAKMQFFLIPLPSRESLRNRAAGKPTPNVRMVEGTVWIDEFATSIVAQRIPYTNKDWYFHYNPNREHKPFLSSTLNLSPACPERCTLCAGAKTGRVNNGQLETMAADVVVNHIADTFPDSLDQLDIVAVVTGCFDRFATLYSHLETVKHSVNKRFSPTQFRVLEHNINTEEQFSKVVGELGYDVYVTLECFDPKMRYLALNGRLGRKGRSPDEFIDIVRTYARYLSKHPELGKKFVKVTYIMGIDSLDVTEALFKTIKEVNREFPGVTILPWLSIFTPYDRSMQLLQCRDFSLSYILRAHDLCRRYFDNALLATECGGTVDGYARGLF